MIGSDLESAVYAFLSNAFYLPTCLLGPLFYKNSSPLYLGSNRGDYSWSRIMTIMGLESRLLNYPNLKSIRLEEDTIKISSPTGVKRYKFGSCKVFDTTLINLTNEILEHRPSIYRVYDDFEISGLGGKRKYIQPKVTDEELATEIHYYISSRVHGAKYITDCVVESNLTRNQLNDFNYSDTMVRFSIARHLESIGIKGKLCGVYKSGKQKFRSPTILHKKRILFETEKNIYEDSEKVKFINYSMEEIFDKFCTTRS